MIPRILLFFLAIKRPTVDARSNGSPYCVDVPRHPWGDAAKKGCQKTGDLLEIVRTDNGNKVDFVVKSAMAFKGFTVVTNDPGMFDTNNNDLRPITPECNGFNGTLGKPSKGFTHKNANLKKEVKFTFMKAAGAKNKPKFSLSLVRAFNTYWCKINGESKKASESGGGLVDNGCI